jgi:tRNA 2-thiouridine synthesizing protein A
MRRVEDGTLPPEESASTGTAGAGLIRLDCIGMRCPQPVLRLAVEAAEAPAGTFVEILGDCPTFEHDVRVFCERRKKSLLAVRRDGARTFIRIRC